MDERGFDFCARQQLIEMSDAFIADERALSGLPTSARGVRRAGDDLTDLAARLAAKRATQSASFHLGDHL